MHLTLRASLLLLLLIATAGLVAGCGSDDATGDDDGGSSSTAASKKADDGAADAAQATADLVLRLTGVGSKTGAGIAVPTNMQCTMSIPAQCNAQIECPVAEDSDDDDARSVCQWLADEGRAVLTEEPDEGAMCTQQYGGPERAVVTGTLEGEEVDATFSRENGCEIARFDTLLPLWNGLAGQAAAHDGAPPAPDEIEDPPSAFDK